MNVNDKDRNQEATVYVGNLDERMTDPLLWELMLQAGPVVHIHLPKDRVSQLHQGYAFCEFVSEEDADYAIKAKIMNMVKLFGKPIRLNKASADKKSLDVGATLFIGNLDPEVDEQMLFDTFSAFGNMVQAPMVGRDPDTGASRGFGFVSFDCFESSDAAVQAMNGQFLCNRMLSVSYALKKDGKGERHGSAAERLLAAQSRKNQQPPNQYFADVGNRPPPGMPMPPGMPGMPGGPPMPYPPGYGAPPPFGQPPGPPPGKLSFI